MTTSTKQLRAAMSAATEGPYKVLHGIGNSHWEVVGKYENFICSCLYKKEADVIANSMNLHRGDLVANLIDQGSPILIRGQYTCNICGQGWAEGQPEYHGTIKGGSKYDCAYAAIQERLENM